MVLLGSWNSWPYFWCLQSLSLSLPHMWSFPWYISCVYGHQLTCYSTRLKTTSHHALLHITGESLASRPWKRSTHTWPVHWSDWVIAIWDVVIECYRSLSGLPKLTHNYSDDTARLYAWPIYQLPVHVIKQWWKECSSVYLRQSQKQKYPISKVLCCCGCCTCVFGLVRFIKFSDVVTVSTSSD